MHSKKQEPIIETSRFDAVLFDMDGVVTKTAQLHASAWKQAFDAFLKNQNPVKDFVPFDINDDYLRYVDGKPRFDGVASFLQSRNVKLIDGTNDDAPGFNSIHALGNLKNEIFCNAIKAGKVEVYETTLALIHALKKNGVKIAVITASENGKTILASAQIQTLFDAVVDGIDARNLNLKGKPFPDTFLHAADELKVETSRAVVVEDAEAGVQAGRSGEFGLVIGVNRADHREALRQHGANFVVDDLDEVQVSNTRKELPSYVIADMGISDESWSLVFDDYDPALVGRRESLCMIGNGYISCRAAACETSADSVNSPGSYLAGVYNRLTYTGDSTSFEYEDLVNIPNWTLIQFAIDDEDWVSLGRYKPTRYRQELNLREGILYRSFQFSDDKGRETIVAERRFVHMRSTHMCGVELSITAVNWSGIIKVRSAIDGSVSNIGTRLYSNMDRVHLAPLKSEATDDCTFVLVKTRESQIELAVCAKTRFKVHEKEITVPLSPVLKEGYAAGEYVIGVEKNSPVHIQKIAALFSSKDFAISSPEVASKGAILDADCSSFDELIVEQKEAWRQLWRRFDLGIETDDVNSKQKISLLLHLHSFHVLQTVCINSVDLDVGVPARGWTEGYQGHVFWDDLFCFPFLNLRLPEVTQSLLKYRYRRLPAAREIAAKRGAKGACFPWQSGSSGREETPAAIWYPKRHEWVPDYSHLQIHVNVAIVMDVWLYYQVTGNLEFLYAYGAELVMEVARFLSSIAIWNEERERFEIHGVVGPDEYHVKYPGAENPGINNNAYTNVMASWVLCRALELVKVIPEDRCDELLERLNVSDDEIESWHNMSSKFYVPFGKEGFIEQFEGYENLEEFPYYDNDKLDMVQLDEVFASEGGTFNRYKVSKQADVLMLFYLFSAEELKEIFKHLNYEFDTEAFELNVEYYLKRTSNKSTLSRVALSWVLSRVDRKNSLPLLSSMQKDADVSINQSSEQVEKTPSEDVGASWGLFREALSSDYMDIQGGTTPEGIHLGAMAGTVDIVQRCYTGLVTRDDVLWLNPNLPKGINRLSFLIQYRHQSVKVDICQRRIHVRAGHSSAEAIKVGSKDVVELRSGEAVTFDVKTGQLESRG